MAKTNIGRVSVVPKGEYSSTENYKRLDVVSSDGSMYISKKDNNIGNPLTDENWWFKAVEKGEVGAQGEKPVNGVDYNTDEEKEEFKNDVVSKATEEVEKNIADAETKAIENYNKNADEKLTDYDTNASNKLKTYNDNTTEKLKEYNDNASEKLESYNTNSTSKVNEFNTNASTKTTEFDTNAITKTNDFNSNATAKTNAFNDNYDEKMQAMNEASTSIEVERIKSDKKYARAIDSDVISVDNFGQVECDDDGYAKDLEIESTLPEITQDSREGYNKLDISTLQELDQDGVKLTKENGVVTLNGKSTATSFIDAYIVGSSSNYEEFLTAGKYTVSGITGEVLSPNFGILIVIKHIDETTITIMQNSENKVFNVTEGDTFRVFIRIPQNLQLNNIVIRPMIVSGTENKDFEQYGVSPSLNYPSEFKNIINDIKIQNIQENLVYIDNESYIPGYTAEKAGIQYTIQDDYGLKCVGTATENSNVQIIIRETGKNKLTVKNLTGKIYSYIIGNSISGARIVAHTVDGAYIPITNTGYDLTKDKYFDNLYAEVTAGSTVDCVIYPQITYDNVDEYIPYKSYSKQITLPENNFLGSFNGYKNTIKNGKLNNNLKMYKADSSTDFSINATDDNRVQFLTPVIDDLKPELGHNDILSNIAETSGSSSTKKIRFWISYEELGTTSENTNTEHITALKNKLLNITGEFLYPVDNEEETQLEDINLLLYKGINNILAEDLKISFKQNMKAITERTANNRYARALKAQVEDVQQTQIYAENDVVENLIVKGAELTQKTRDGYNLLNLEKYSYSENQSVLNGGTVSIKNGILNIDAANATDNMTVKSKSISVENRDMLPPGEYYFGVYINGYYESEQDTLVQFAEGVVTLTENYYLSQWYAVCNKNEITNKKLLISNDSSKTDYEQYGVSPSLDYPSEVNIPNMQNISICRKNIIDTNDINKSSSGIATISKNDGGININGTPTSTFFTIKSIDLNVPIKVGTKLFMNYGKTEKLLRDNTDFSPYFWLVNKDGNLFKTLNKNNINSYSVEQEIYRISFGIEALVVGKQYSEDIYIELEISDEQPTQFQKYETTNINIAIENSAIGNYFDVIDRENKKQEKMVQELILTGDETDWGREDTAVGTRFWKPLKNCLIANASSNKSALCSHFKLALNGETYNSTKNLFAIYNVGSIRRIAFGSFTDISTVDEWKAKIKELYEAGTPVKIYYVAETADKISLSEEVKQELDKFKLYDGLNNIFIDNGSLSFKYNKSLLRAFEEQSELSASLLERVQALEAAQLSQVGGN